MTLTPIGLLRPIATKSAAIHYVCGTPFDIRLGAVALMWLSHLQTGILYVGCLMAWPLALSSSDFASMLGAGQ